MRMSAVIILIVSACLVSPAVSQDSPADRMAAAKRYAAVIEFDQLLENSILQTARSAQEHIQSRLIEHMRRELNRELLVEAMLDAMVRNFTTEELNALADFYSSPHGRAITKKLPQYNADLYPRIMSEVQRIVSTFK